MKKILVLLLIIPFLSLTAQTDDTKFIGRWTGDSKNEIGYMNFDSEGYAYFEVQGQIFGGKEFVYEGKKGSMTYEINSKADIIEVDLTLTKLESGEQKTLLCIANFIDKDTMKFAIGYDDSRPTDFLSRKLPQHICEFN